MLTLTITDEQLKESFDSHLEKLLKAGEYYSPVKQAIEKLLGYNGSMKDEFTKHIATLVRSVVESPDFTERLGKAIVEELARIEANKIKDKMAQR